MSRRLIVVRHAKSEWPDEVPDHERPLARRGRREAPLVGRWLNQHCPDVDLVVCSPAKRARQTWSRIAKELDAAPALRIDERLYAASLRDLITVAHELPDTARTVVFVGHNPGLENLVSELTGTRCTLKTSSVAVVSAEDPWAAIGSGTSTVENIATPRS
jgi:phosphohistidine phosphatase